MDNMEENFETSNINIKWLENIYDQLRTIQDLERMAREGCRSLMEFLEIPPQMYGIIIPEARYRNIKFLALELDILINNLVPVIDSGTEKYKNRLKMVIKNIDNRNLFLENAMQNNMNYIKTKPLLSQTITLLIEIKSDIIKDIASILYIKEDVKDKW